MHSVVCEGLPQLLCSIRQILMLDALHLSLNALFTDYLNLGGQTY